jgi:phospholipid/cholesterol/gamma-HCH transport system substrate-binding protein
MRRRDEVAVGMLVTGAVAVLMLGVLWLARGGLSSGYPLYTRFAWGQNLKQGQPVLLAGVSVGYVDNVDLRPDGYLFVMMRINDAYHVPKGAVSSVHAVGFFGDVAVALTPVLGAKVDVYAPGDTVPTGPAAANVDELMSRVDSIGIAIGAMTQAMHKELVETGGLKDLRSAIASTAALAAQLQSMAAEQNAHLSATLEEFRHAAHSLALDSATVDSTMRNFRETSDNLTRFSNKLNATTEQFSSVLTQLQHGEGSAGKLLTDTLLYSNLQRLAASADSLLRDFQANPKKYINVKFSIFGGGSSP